MRPRKRHGVLNKQGDRPPVGIAEPERGDGARLEALAELVDALGGVGALPVAVMILVDAAERIPAKTATHDRNGAGKVQNVKGR